MSRCPHPACNAPKPGNMYACRKHWFSLPQNIRNAIWAAYKGSGALSEPWLKADKQATDFWEAQQETKRLEQKQGKLFA